MMPLNTIVVNQGDFQTDVPEGKERTIITDSSLVILTPPAVSLCSWTESNPPPSLLPCEEEDSSSLALSSSSSLMKTEVPAAPEGGSSGCDDLPVASNKGWGIPEGLGLRGGGLSSLNNGTSGWGAPPSNPNAGSGWGAPPGQGGGAGGGGGGGQGASSAASSSPPNNNGSGWGSNNSPNRNTSQNGQQNLTAGSQQMNNNPNGNASGQGSGGSSSMQLTNQNSNSQPGLTGSSSWAQAAGKSLQNSSSASGGGGAPPPSSSCATAGGVGAATNATNANNANNNPGNNPNASSSGPSSVTSKQLEQLNSMREALFSHDGWGGQNVNQDSGWDIPGSPEPTHKDLGGGQMAAPAGTSVWKVNINNGTDLWEATLRNGGAPPPAPAQPKASWVTPATNIGGTWGEDDDAGADSSSVWNGPNNSSSAQPGSGGAGRLAEPNNSSGGWAGPQQQQQQTRGDHPSGGGGMWNSTPGGGASDWGSRGGGPDSNRPMPGGGVGMDPHPHHHRWGEGTSRSNSVDANPNNPPGMWNKPVGPPGPPPGPQQTGGGGGAGWGGPGPGMGGGMDKKNSGWDDVSPPTQRRPVPNIPNYDDGTSLWGNAMPGTGGQGGGHPGNRGGMPGPGRMPPSAKMDEGAGPGGWGGPNRSNGWSGPDGPQDGFNGRGGGGWEDKNIGSWGGEPMGGGSGGGQPNSSWGKPKTPTNAAGWTDDEIVDTSRWGGGPPKGPTNSSSSRICNGGSPNMQMSNGQPSTNHHSNTKDTYWSSSSNGNIRLHQGRSNHSHNDFVYSNNKKDDLAELALRASNMNLADAIDSLDGVRGAGGPPLGDPPLWGSGGPGGMPQQRGGHRGGPPGGDHDFDLLGGGPMGPPGGPGRYGMPGGNPGKSGGFGAGGGSLMNNVNPNVGGGSINPILLQKFFSQQQSNNPQGGRMPGGPNNPSSGPNPPGGFPGGPPVNKASSSVGSLVQQIHLAVQAGYLSNQILQHPLPPQSIILLNQILQHIKHFHLLTQAQQQMGNSNSPAALSLSVKITQTKQAIQNLHNQIAAQQAQHVKQQHEHRHGHGPGNGPDPFYNKGNQPLIGGGGDGRGGGGGGGPLMDPFGHSDFLMNNKDAHGSHQAPQQTSRLSQWTKIDKEDGGDAFSRAPGGPQNPGNPGNKGGNLLEPSDNTWSSVGSRGTGEGWPTGNSSNEGGGDGNKQSSGGGDAWQTDLVPEFEPGKPWKGTQILKNVDDDPTLTPGSVVRSPLSLATAAAAEIFAKSTNSSVSSLAADTLPLSLSSSSTWSYTPTSSNSTSIANSLAKLNSTRELWDYGGGQGQGGNRPPPGLPKKQQGGVPGGNGGNNQFGFLLLRNLTKQIDGSTLRTLCMQHGPLQMFHLNLNYGIAAVKYGSKDEAAKAQGALNNCVLGNTTILAELVDWQQIQALNSDMSGGYPSTSSTTTTPSSADNPWGLRDNSPLWSGGGGGPNPWEAEADRATPSSLNSLLPDGLLGGESA